MNSKNFSKRGKPLKSRKPQNGGNNFAKPNLRDITNGSSVVTLESLTVLTLTATTGIIPVLTSSSFARFNQLATDFRWYEITGHRIEVDWDNPTGSQTAASFAFYPLNYIADPATYTTPTSNSAIDSLPGSIQLMPGSSNRGRWSPAHIKQQFSTATTVANNSPLGLLLAYINVRSATSVTLSVGVTVFLNVKFYGSRYNNVLQIPHIIKCEPIKDSEDQLLEATEPSVEFIEEIIKSNQ